MRASSETSAARWTTPKLGVAISTSAVIIAAVLDAVTELAGQTIVLGVMVVAFVISLQATARRPLAER